MWRILNTGWTLKVDGMECYGRGVETDSKVVSIVRGVLKGRFRARLVLLCKVGTSTVLDRREQQVWAEVQIMIGFDVLK